MFENTPTSAPVPPSNLPTEPDDMFSAVEPSVSPAPAAPSDPPNALEAGLLRPKAPSVTTMPRVPEPNAVGIPAPEAVTATRAPVVGKILIALVVIVVLVGGGIGGFVLYRRSTASQLLGNANSVIPAVADASQTPPPAAPVSEVDTAPAEPPSTAPIVDAAPSDNSTIPAAPSPTTTDAASKTMNDQILFGEQVDSDKDGVSDNDEITLYRTDPRNADTDGDMLSDGEELLVWKTEALKPDTDADSLPDGEEVKWWQTNPLNPDSDGDSHVDGKEVFNGYNPNGPGKIQKLPDGMSTSTYDAKYKK